MYYHSLRLFLILAALLASGKVFAIHPDELFVNCFAHEDSTQCYREYKDPCVASAISGDHSIQDVLNKLSFNMGSFWIDDPDSKMCDIDENTRLVLLSPDGLTDARVEGSNRVREESVDDYVKTIASKINDALTISIPGGEHLILAGYKTLYHSSVSATIATTMILTIWVA